MAACSSHGHPEGHAVAQTQTARLKTTLSSLKLNDPGEDARAHVAAGDLRPVGIYGYTCSIPGPEGNLPPPAVGIRCLDGTSDAAESGEHEHLIETARVYALAYDQELKKITAK